MVHLSVIDAQLTKLGVKKTFLCKPEIHELQRILMEGEDIIKCVPGRYSGGFAILVATDHRLLLIDKKPMYLTVEDIRYDMISEVHLSAGLFNATLTLYTVNKQLAFSAYRQHQLRELTSFAQKRVMELRQYHHEGSVQIDNQQIYTHPLAAMAQPAAAYQPPPPQMLVTAPAVEPTQPPRRHFVPTAAVQKIVGAAALRATRRHDPNPYTKAPLMVHQSGFRIS